MFEREEGGGGGVYMMWSSGKLQTLRSNQHWKHEIILKNNFSSRVPEHNADFWQAETRKTFLDFGTTRVDDVHVIVLVYKHRKFLKQ